MEKLFKLMECNGGYSLTHTKGLTKKEADEMRDHHADTFPDIEWWVQPHQEQDEQDRPKYKDDKAVDGWEDFFDYYD